MKVLISVFYLGLQNGGQNQQQQNGGNGQQQNGGSGNQQQTNGGGNVQGNNNAGNQTSGQNNNKLKRQQKMTVAMCDQQMSQCNTVVRAAAVQSFDLVNLGPDPNDPSFDLLCQP